MANGTLAPNPVFTGWDANGDPLPGGLLSTFAAGTSTPLATYSDVGLTTPNANPVVLDSAGRCVLFLSAASYKFVLKNSAGVTQWTQDNISAVPASQVNVDIDGVAGEALAAGDAIYLSSGAADGGRTAGQWYKADAAAPLRSTLATALGMAPNAITMSSTGSSRLSGRITGLAGLTAGVLYYVSSTTPGALTSVAPTNARAIATADSTTSVVMSQFIPVPNASSTVAGIVSLGAQTLGTGTKTVDAIVVTGASTLTGQVTAALPVNFFPGTSGSGATVAIVDGVIYSDSAPHTTAIAGTETDTSSFSVPDKVLSANGKILRVTAWGKYVGGGAVNHRIRLYYGGTVIAEYTAPAQNRLWSLSGTIQRTAAATQTAFSEITEFNNTINSLATGSTATPNGYVFDNLAKDTTVAQIVKVTLTDTTTAAITTQLGFVIEVVG